MSSNTGLIADPAVTYTSGSATGSLSHTHAAHAAGTSAVTGRVKDDGGTSNGGVDTTLMTFTVSVTSVNDVPVIAQVSDPAAILEDAGSQSVSLAGIGDGDADVVQGLAVPATSSNTDLIADPVVT